eukprot:3839393-Rhodomonas_salina.1
MSGRGIAMVEMAVLSMCGTGIAHGATRSAVQGQRMVLREERYWDSAWCYATVRYWDSVWCYAPPWPSPYPLQPSPGSTIPDLSTAHRIAPYPTS